MKPENIMIGMGKKANIVYMIDFGLVKRYISPQTGKHIAHTLNKGVFGTSKYLSRNAHSGNEQSRIDDLLALGNIMVYFLKKGILPWDTESLPEF